MLEIMRIEFDVMKAKKKKTNLTVKRMFRVRNDDGISNIRSGVGMLLCCILLHLLTLINSLSDLMDGKNFSTQK